MAGLREDRTSEGALAFEDAVRSPIEVDELRLRVTDRLAARLPGLARTLAPRLIAAPAGSKLRTALLTRMMIAGFAAADQRDWSYMRRFYAPEMVWRTVPGFWLDAPEHAVGFPAVQVRLASFLDAFGDTDFRPVEFLDLGGPFFGARVATNLKGRYSGIVVTNEAFYVYELGAAGVIIRQWATNTLAEAAAFYEQRRA